MVYLASYTELTRLSSTNLLIPLRLSSGRIDGTAKRRTVRGGGAVYFAAISPLPPARGDGPCVGIHVAMFCRCSVVRPVWKRESWNWKPANRLRNRPALFNFCPIARGVGRHPCHPPLPPFFSFRVFLYIIPSCNFSLSRPFIFQRPLFCTAFFLFSLFPSFFPFPPFAATLALPIFPTLYIVHFLSTSPSPNTVLLPVSSLFSFFLSFFRSFVQPSLFLSVSLSSVPAMGMTMEEMGW